MYQTSRGPVSETNVPQGVVKRSERSNVIYPMQVAERKFKDHQHLVKASGMYPVSKAQLDASFKRIEELTILGLNDHSLKRQCRKDPYACNDIIFGMFDTIGDKDCDYKRKITKR